MKREHKTLGTAFPAWGFLLVALVSSCAEEPIAPAINLGGQIAFSRGFEEGLGDGKIYLINADGSRLTHVLTGQGDTCCLHWSPDGSKIAFGGYFIYVVNADGSGFLDLTNTQSGMFGAAWSPDGTKIAFSSTLDGIPAIYSDYRIFLMNADGSGVTRLTNDPVGSDNDAAAQDLGPTWSPDGTKIAFRRRWSNDDEIIVMNADGSDPRNLTNHLTGDHGSTTFGPRWSPDGTRMLFESTRDDDEGLLDVYRINADGSLLVNLTNSPGVSDQAAQWSPDGAKIVFVNQRDVNDGGLYVMNSDGSGLSQLTNSHTDGWPAWRPRRP